MPDYRVTKTKYSEEYVNSLFNENGIISFINNQTQINAVDLICENKKVDVQFSQDFKKYGDLRVDLISAYNKNKQNDLKSYFFNEIQNRHNIHIEKKGKFFQKDYLDFLVVLFYNYKLDMESPKEPDYIMIISKNDLFQYFKNNANILLNKVKLNNKDGLGDKHGSAFIPLNVQNIVSQEYFSGYFGSIEDFKKNALKVKEYIRRD